MPQTNSYHPWLCILPDEMARRCRLTPDVFRQTLYIMEKHCWIEPLQYFGIHYHLTVRVSKSRLLQACPSNLLRSLNQLLGSCQRTGQEYHFHLFRQATSMRQDPEHLHQLCQHLVTHELADLKISGEIIRTRLRLPGDLESLLIRTTTVCSQQPVLPSLTIKNTDLPAIF